MISCNDDSLKESKCVIILTHSKSIMAVADHITVIGEGAVVAAGSFTKILEMSATVDAIHRVLHQTSDSELAVAEK